VVGPELRPRHYGNPGFACLVAVPQTHSIMLPHVNQFFGVNARVLQGLLSRVPEP